MTNEDFIRLARAAGVPLDFTMYRNGPVGSFTMQEFINMMRAAYSAGQLEEREACAKLAEGLFFRNPSELNYEIAAEIRARN